MMSSQGEVPKQPSDLRNGDLVSRLLAATPPYLYNMPLLPNSFFFSEMLRSFVAAKNSATSNTSHPATPGRRGRKRSWKDTKDTTRTPHPSSLNLHQEGLNRTHNQHQQHLSLNVQHQENANNNHTHQHQSLNLHQESNNNNREDKPLELTTSRTTPPPPNINNNKNVNLINNENVNLMNNENVNPAPGGLLLPPPFPPTTPQVPSSQIWYPPSMYQPPPPFDPLHFFIDLRVSGHIWDQTKNNPVDSVVVDQPLDLQTDHQRVEDGGDLKATLMQQNQASLFNDGLKTTLLQNQALFKASRKHHVSAFAVPRPREIAPEVRHKILPEVGPEDNKDVHQTVSANYVLQNLSKIYREVEIKSKREEEEVKVEEKKEETLGKVGDETSKVKEGEIGNKATKIDEDNKEVSEKEKKCRDLRALIGLELVKDYVGLKTPHPHTKNDDDDLEMKKEETTEQMNDVDDEDDDSNIQVDDDDEDDDDNFVDDGFKARSINFNRGGKYLDYSQASLKE
ncbi:bromodomain-containing protein DDB_G0270170 [Nilaparvata lugens]|uniref:bromodomain-containing protein DDB_G0270170 n=1 Tax=Nilaparvata lugens TaxID=108931 RepID=UPI00193E53F1|nr:bromodomain-containing protein DDB_G0270170 [Nilaparvata lugens]XP_039297284.1 bromodomain-containing protein DDB_G0270170 [Nilaparvata lugens]XP_039297291.1 bromodomain-containing protein DDB_G0270170 [Nilaparvata lugens]XP_039297297.1 bromodomain-containing protein DDB_G0270170 [Nilaparvata lugens]XP_039297308.1 bromodomain-containing protein DDB_G0270170 [Nilaparvata lugens]